MTRQELKGLELDADFPEKLQCLFEPYWQYIVAKGGRGGAKSWAFARALLIKGAAGPLRWLCARETMISLKDSVHALLRDQVQMLGLEREYDIGERIIRSRAGAEFTFAGLKHNVQNIKSYEGADGCWIEEAQTLSLDSWNTVDPTIRKPGSQIWISYNPQFETDAVHKIFVIDEPPPRSIVVDIGWEDNRWFPEELDIKRRHMLATNPVLYRHIWEGECRTTVEGAVFGKEIEKAMAAGQISDWPHDPRRPVNTYWDLGYDDRTAIWFTQAYGGYYYFIDYIESRGETVEWYVRHLKTKEYNYAEHWLPHDGVDAMTHAKFVASKDKSPEMVMRELGLNVRVAAKTLVSTGIDAARTIFPLCRFNADMCDAGLRALRMYQWGPPSKSGIVKREPLHDAASHGADAFRVAAMRLKQPEKEQEKKPPAPPPRVKIPGPYRPFG